MTDETDNGAGQGMIEAAANRFFPEGGPEQVEVPLFGDLRQQLAEFAAARGMSEPDAIRLALAAGLAFLVDQEHLRAAGDAGGRSAEELERLLARHVTLEGDYAVLKHRLWLALQDNQTMSLRDGSLSKSVQGLQALTKKLRADIAALEAENADLRLRQPAPPDEGPPAPAESQPPVSWRARLQARLGRSPDDR